MTDTCWRPRCATPIPPDSHSPRYCSISCETQAILEVRGETAQPSADFLQAPPEKPLSKDGYGAVAWTELSWWPHPKQQREAAS
jgi:hypothetical protein